MWWTWAYGEVHGVGPVQVSQWTYILKLTGGNKAMNSSYFSVTRFCFGKNET